MTPTEKAKELLDKYYIEHYCWNGNGYDVDKVTTKQCQKQCALIAVDEILQTFSVNWLWCSIDMKDKALWKKEFEFWQQVKKELQKL
jgi:hypothetical protein